MHHQNLDCRFCKHYSPEGQRGGTCQLMNIFVQGNWKSCTYGEKQFSSR